MSKTSIERSLAARTVPDATELATLLRDAQRPLLLVGRGVLWSQTWQAVAELAQTFPHARVMTTPGAKGCFPDTNPQNVGVLGFGGSKAAAEAFAAADVVLVLGTRLLEQSSLDWHARFGEAGVYRFDVHASRLVGEWPRQVPIDGDLRDTLPALNRAALALGSSPIRTACTPRTPSVADALIDTLTLEGAPLAPRTVVGMLSRARTTPVCADAGNSMCWALECLTRDEPGTFYVSLDWGTMGFALPAALGIAIATRNHVIALTGDGSMAMAGGELHTAVEQRLPLIVVVLNDSGAGMVRAGTALWFSDLPELPGLAYDTPLDLAGFATSLGASGVHVRTAVEFECALAAALLRPTPTLIDVVIDAAPIPRAISARVAGLGANTPSTRTGGGIC